MSSTPPSRVADWITLAKIRVNALVVATTAGGFYMAAQDEVDLLKLAVTCVGTALVAGGAAAFNQVTERHTDALMDRTKHRPVAGKRMSPLEGRVVAAVLHALRSAIDCSRLSHQVSVIREIVHAISS